MVDKQPQILLLGGLKLRGTDGAATPPLTGTARELLAYLCTHAGKEVRRERVADIFWPDLDEARGRAALNTAVWRINKCVKACPVMTLRSTPEHLTLETAEGVAVDVRLLEDAVRAAVEAWSPEPSLSHEVRLALAAGVAHYDAPFLDDCASEWAVVERERLLILYLRGLSILMHDCGARHDFEGALEYGVCILASDPFREQVQCEVMWLHVLKGQRAKALRQFRDYRALLAREMGIEPMAEMRALAAHIENDPDAERRLVEGGLDRASGVPLASVLQSVSRTRLDTYRTLQVG